MNSSKVHCFDQNIVHFVSEELPMRDLLVALSQFQGRAYRLLPTEADSLRCVENTKMMRIKEKLCCSKETAIKEIVRRINIATTDLTMAKPTDSTLLDKALEGLRNFQGTIKNQLSIDPAVRALTNRCFELIGDPTAFNHLEPPITPPRAPKAPKSVSSSVASTAASPTRSYLTSSTPGRTTFSDVELMREAVSPIKGHPIEAITSRNLNSVLELLGFLPDAPNIILGQKLSRDTKLQIIEMFLSKNPISAFSKDDVDSLCIMIGKKTVRRMARTMATAHIETIRQLVIYNPSSSMKSESVTISDDFEARLASILYPTIYSSL